MEPGTYLARPETDLFLLYLSQVGRGAELTKREEK